MGLFRKKPVPVEVATRPPLPGPEEVQQASSAYWREISRILFGGAVPVAFIAIFVPPYRRALMADSGGGVVALAHDEMNSSAVFGFILAAVVSLQILTRTSVTGAEARRTLGRSEALSYVAILLVPVALGTGVIDLVSVLGEPSELPNVWRVLGTAGASLLLAVFAADASLATDDVFDKKIRKAAGQRQYRTRLRNELVWLRSGQTRVMSGRRLMVGWGVLAGAPVAMVVALWWWIPQREVRLVPFAAAVFVLIVGLVGMFSSLVLRRRRVDALLVATFALLFVALIGFGLANVWASQLDGATSAAVKEFACRIFWMLVVLSLPLICALFEVGPRGVLRHAAFHIAARRLVKARRAPQDKREDRASALAWGALVCAVLVSPVGMVLARIALSQSRKRATSRRLAWAAMIIAGIEIVAVLGAFIVVAVFDIDWLTPAV